MSRSVSQSLEFEVRQIINGIIADLGVTVIDRKPRAAMTNHHNPFLGMGASWHDVWIADPAVTFKIGIASNLDVFLMDLHREFYASTLRTNLNYPLSINKIKGFILTCKEKPWNDGMRERRSHE